MPKNVFVLMPFGEKFDDIYSGFIKVALEDIGFNVFRADDIISQQSILKDIISSIQSSDLIIADLTGSNSNVYYELGIAHTFNKPVVLLSQDLSELPFDLKGYRTIEYDPFMTKIMKGIDQLKMVGNQIIKGEVRFGNPVSDFRSTIASTAEKEEIVAEISTAESVNSELGFLDHIVNIEQGFDALTGSINDSTSTMNKVTDHSTAVAKQLNRFNRDRGQSNHLVMKKYLQTQGREMGKFANEMASNNDSYSAGLASLGDSLELAMTMAAEYNQNDRQDLNAFVKVLDQMEANAKSARDTLSSLVDIVDKIPNMEVTYNNAKRHFASELHQYVNNIEQTIALTSRARGMVDGSK